MAHRNEISVEKDEATGNAIRVEGVMKEHDGAPAGYYMILSSIVGGSERWRPAYFTTGRPFEAVWCPIID